MVKLSLYSNNIDSPREILPWEFWTDEERAYVVNQGYDQCLIKSSEVKGYLDASALYTATNLVFPFAVFFGYQRLLKPTVFRAFGARYSSPLVGGIIAAVSSVLWVNLSPFYALKQSRQEVILNTLYKRLGNGVTGLNDILPRFWTTRSIDSRTRTQYRERNGMFAGYLYPEEDVIAPLTATVSGERYKKKFSR